MFTSSLTTKRLVAGLLFSLASMAFASIASANDFEAGFGGRMVVPAAVRVPAGKSLADVKDAIYKSISGRGWTSKEVTPNLIQATYDKNGKGSVVLVVDLKYDTNQVEMSYKDSKRLKYEVVNGEPMLHHRANGWMKNLASDIGRFMAR